MATTLVSPFENIFLERPTLELKGQTIILINMIELSVFGKLRLIKGQISLQI